MESLLFHPKMVHLPMALGILMPLVAIGIAIAWWRKWLPPRAWAVAVLLQAALVGTSILAIRSGEREGEKVEQVVSDRWVDAHEDAAKAFTMASTFVLGLMVFAGGLSASKRGLQLALLSGLGTLAVLGLGVQTGRRGGSLVYEHGAAQVYAKPGAGQDLVIPEASRSESEEGSLEVEEVGYETFEED